MIPLQTYPASWRAEPGGPDVLTLTSLAPSSAMRAKIHGLAPQRSLALERPARGKQACGSKEAEVSIGKLGTVEIHRPVSQGLPSYADLQIQGRNSSYIAVTMTRETEQLVATANHYLAEGRRLLVQKPDLTTLTIGEITRRHRRGSLSPGEVVLAHFGSAAVRLATMCEIAGYRPTEDYRHKFYEPSGKRKTGWSGQRVRAGITAQLHEHLHLLLRDNVAHEEPGIANNKQIAADRFAILKATTIGTCNEVLGKIAKRLGTRR